MSAIKKRSLTANFLFNSLHTVLNLIFPLVTFPYVSRILGPDNLGIVQLASSFAYYFVLVAACGFPLYGTREIARKRSEQLELNRTFSEIFILNGVTVLLASAVYFLSIAFIHKMQAHRAVYLVFGLNILFSIFSFDWLYGGLESFAYITIRDVFFKLISIALMFFIVRRKDDYLPYAVVSVVYTCASYVVNMVVSWRFVRFDFRHLNLLKHLRPMIVIFGATIVSTAYRNLDIVVLGLLTQEKYVAFYSLNKNLTRVLYNLVLALSAVMIPRLAYLFKEDREQYKVLLQRSLNFILLLSLPISVGMALLAKEIALVFAGSEFLEAARSLIIMAPLVFVVCFNSLLSFQIALPADKEKYIFLSLAVSAVVNILLNFLLIGDLKHVGAGIALLVAEVAGCITLMALLGKQYRFYNFQSRNLVNYIAGSVVVGTLVWVGKQVLENSMLVLSACVAGSVLGYFGLLRLLKDDMVLAIERRILSKVRRLGR